MSNTPPVHLAPARIHPGLLPAMQAVGDALSAMAQERLAAGATPTTAFSGLQVDIADVEQALARSPLYGARPHRPDSQSFSLPLVPGSPLDIACKGLALSSFDIAVIAMALLVELDGRYGSVIAFLHDDVTRKQPSVELALALFTPGGPGALEYLANFAPSATLARWHLMEIAQDEALIRQSLQLDRAFLWFLLGDLDLDPTLGAVAQVAAREKVSRVPVTASLVEVVATTLGAGTPVLLHGEDEQSCLATAAAAATRAQRRLLIIDGELLAEQETAEATVQRCLREAVLKDLQPCLIHAASLLQQTSTRAEGCRKRLMGSPVPVLLVNLDAGSEVAYGGPGVVPLAVPAPMAADRLAHWQEMVRLHGLQLDERTLLALSETEGLRGTIIEEISAVAQAAAAADGVPATGPYIQRAARGALRQHAPSLTITQPRFSWDDIVLPADRLQVLRHLCSRVRYRSLVQQTWGMGRGTVPGVTALFAGQPGTGKSMASEVIASDLGLDLCKIDLSQVVSKFIGETEKNLARIFNEAEQCGVVLVFDEADALFGKRSDVKDSHDRYANIETSYLLQRMERYRGLAVLTTNLRANLDEAFTRRIGVSIDFPMPNAADRLRLWRRALAGAPYDPELNLTEVAERLEIAGGSIINAALASAFLAAEEQGPVNGERLLRGVRWELQKAGRLMGSDALDALLPATASAARNGR